MGSSPSESAQELGGAGARCTAYVVIGHTSLIISHFHLKDG